MRFVLGIVGEMAWTGEIWFEDKGNYKALCNRKDQTEAKNLPTLGKQWLSVDWGNDILKMNLKAF